VDIAVYAVEAKAEATHWWFVGRRKLFARELELARVAKDAAILDVGTGTGSNLRMLRDLGYHNVTGLDSSDEAIRFCAAKGLATVRKGDICAIPFADSSFEFVLATDVIEHVDDDDRAVQEIARVLRPGGKALIAVPAFPALWGLQDRQSFHKRRYRMKPLMRLLQSAGLNVNRNYHFNYFLFLPILLARKAIDLLKLELHSEGQVNSPWLNRILDGIFTVDVSTAPILRPPFGVSILAIASKPR
jgi:SAM-dependent methyltransferase